MNEVDHLAVSGTSMGFGGCCCCRPRPASVYVLTDILRVGLSIARVALAASIQTVKTKRQEGALWIEKTSAKGVARASLPWITRKMRVPH